MLCFQGGILKNIEDNLLFSWGDNMGNVKVRLEGNFEDMFHIYEFMRYNTKGVSEAKWLRFSGIDASRPPTSVEYTAKL